MFYFIFHSESIYLSVKMLNKDYIFSELDPLNNDSIAILTNRAIKVIISRPKSPISNNKKFIELPVIYDDLLKVFKLTRLSILVL
jgi:hypothetical protein